jgi:hypothetical protein
MLLNLPVRLRAGLYIDFTGILQPELFAPWEILYLLHDFSCL